MQITTGFLAGNILAGDYSEHGINEDASITRYQEMLTAAIQAAYPAASVEVRYQDAEGSLPHDLKTHVYMDPDEPGDSNEEDRITEHVNSLCAQVWEAFNWVVYTPEA